MERQADQGKTRPECSVNMTRLSTLCGSDVTKNCRDEQDGGCLIGGSGGKRVRGGWRRLKARPLDPTVNISVWPSPLSTDCNARQEELPLREERKKNEEEGEEKG